VSLAAAIQPGAAGANPVAPPKLGAESVISHPSLAEPGLGIANVQLAGSRSWNSCECGCPRRSSNSTISLNS